MESHVFDIPQKKQSLERVMFGLKAGNYDAEASEAAGHGFGLGWHDRVATWPYSPMVLIDAAFRQFLNNGQQVDKKNLAQIFESMASRAYAEDPGDIGETGISELSANNGPTTQVAAEATLRVFTDKDDY